MILFRDTNPGTQSHKLYVPIRQQHITWNEKLEMQTCKYIL